MEQVQDLKRVDVQEEQLRIQLRIQGEQITAIVRSSEGYRKVRMRFLATWNRDILGNATDKDLNCIQEGNTATRGGDAVTNATLDLQTEIANVLHR